RLGPSANARAEHGAPAPRLAQVLRTAQRYTGAAQHVVQPRRRTHRQSRRRGILHLPAQWNRRVDSRPDAGGETGINGNTPGASRVLKKRGRIRRSLIVLGNAGGSIADLARGMWRSGPAKRWLLPLAVFLCVLGLVLVRSEEHTSELQSLAYLVCRLLLEKK